jgi:hypothetical protein
MTIVSPYYLTQILFLFAQQMAQPVFEPLLYLMDSEEEYYSHHLLQRDLYLHLPYRIHLPLDALRFFQLNYRNRQIDSYASVLPDDRQSVQHIAR